MKQIWHSAQWPRFIYDSAMTELPLARALQAIGEIQGLQAGLSLSDQDDLRFGRIVDEALASFGIEGVSLNAAEIEASVIASMRHRHHAPPSRRSDAIVELLMEAREQPAHLDQARLLAWHQLLFYGIEVEDKGRWRSFDLEIIRSAHAGFESEVLYKAPPPAILDKEMALFFDWLDGETSQPAAIKAALAHLWFESIHPFSDGNGRIGRALIDYIFAQDRALPFSLSRQIEREKKAYYAALQAGRQEGQGGIDATPFVVWFLECLFRAAQSSRAEAHFLTRRNAFFLRFGKELNPRQDKAFRLLFAQGVDRLSEGVNARSWCKMTGVSAATATRDLGDLMARGVLRAGQMRGRSMVYFVNG